MPGDTISCVPGKRHAARSDSRWTMSSVPGTHPMTCSTTVAELSSPPRILEVKVDDT